MVDLVFLFVHLAAQHCVRYYFLSYYIVFLCVVCLWMQVVANWNVTVQRFLYVPRSTIFFVFFLCCCCCWDVHCKRGAHIQYKISPFARVRVHRGLNESINLVDWIWRLTSHHKPWQMSQKAPQTIRSINSIYFHIHFVIFYCLAYTNIHEHYYYIDDEL